MKVNESPRDRALRGLAGVMLVGLGYFSRTGWLRAVFLVLGAIMLVTAATGWCSIYALLGIKSAKE
jgi:hypothetical protein